MNKFFRIIVSSLFLCASSVHAEIELINVSSSGEPANTDRAFSFSYASTEVISNDGRFVAFTSQATNLVPGDTNELADIFVRDRQSGITKRISVSSTGEQAMLGSNVLLQAFGSTHPSISENGRFIAFGSDAANLVSNDTNASRSDVFVHDQQTGTTELVSYLPNGGQRSWHSGQPFISADGRFVNYTSGSDMYVYDRETEITERILKFSRASFNSISADGRFIAFRSNADDLSQIPDNGLEQAYIHDRQTGEVEMISISMNGEAANETVFFTQISANGRYVLYTTNAGNLVADDTKLFDGEDVFVYDRVTKVTERVSVSSSGDEGNSTASYTIRASISADGRYVVFENQSTNLAPGVTTPGYRIYVHDRRTKITKLVSRLDNGNPFLAEIPTISPDGSFILFQTSDTISLLPGATSYWKYLFGTDNPFFNTNGDSVTVEKLINNETREIPSLAAKLSTGTLYRQSYKVTNDSPNRLYQVKVFENGNLACNFYALNPGQTRQRCDAFQTVRDGEQRAQVTVTAKESGSDDALMSTTDAYYTGLNVNGELRVTHRINNVNADNLDQAQTLSSSQATVSYKVENTGTIELYQVKTYHDPVSPVNSGWTLQCVMGSLKPGQFRYCKRDIDVTELGLNQAMGRVQGRNAIRSATEVVNASNPTYFIVP